MLRSIRQNSLSLFISATAIGGYAAWVALPETTSIQNIYERYLAREESRPRYFDDGISVRLNREAPPVAALEEALREQPWSTIERAPGFNVKATELKPVAAQVEKVALAIITDNRRADSFVRTVEPAQPTLPSLSPTRAVPANSIAAPNRAGTSTMNVAGVRPLPPAPSIPDVVPAEEIPVVRTVSISTSKTGLTRDQILASLFMPIARPSAQPVQTVSPSAAPVFAKTRSNASDLGQGDEESGTRSVAARVVGALAPSGRQILLKGPIELSGGLALTHAKDRIVVLRESRGQLVETGAVWIREARYEIFVEALEGTLVAEVRAPQGEVVGRGQLDLAGVAVNASDRRQIEGVALKVNPVTSGLSGSVRAAYSGRVDGGKGVPGAKVEVDQTSMAMRSVVDGHFESSRLAEGSRIVARVKSKDNWPSIAIMTAGVERAIPVYTNKMMQAFVRLTSPELEAAGEAGIRAKLENNGVVWGRVTKRGQPLAGMKIQVLTEGSANPIYFNDLMLPDQKLQVTGDNGLFAIPASSIGVHSVQVELNGKVSDPVMLVAEAGTVSTLELDAAQATESMARSFDAFRTDLALRTEVRPLGHLKGRRIIVEGENGRLVRLHNMGHPVALELDAGSEYLRTRMIQNPETRYLYMPMVQRSWFDRIVGRMRFNLSANTGNVIGFIQGQRFQVSIDEKSAGPDAKVVYFDSRGEMTGQNFGEPGGGFVLLGLREGLRTVVVSADGSDRVYAATVLVENGVVGSLSHWLR